MTPGIDLTPQDAERLRQILDAYQAKNPPSIKEFDLAKPPTKPYRHQEYPKVMYHHATGRYKDANNAQEEATAIEAGWSTQSVFVEEPQIAVDLSEEEKSVIAAAEADAEQPRRGPGRPPKNQAD